MKFLTKLERKFGKYSIPNLTTMLILGFVVGLVMEIVDPSVIYMVNLDPQKILQGQVWRLISWVLMPPSGISILIILTLMFYWFVGRTLEREWGEFRYNLYIFSGIIFTDLGVLVPYLILRLVGQEDLALMFVNQGLAGVGVSSYFLCLSMFLAFAVLHAEQQVTILFLFVIPVPVKVKWLGYLDVAYLIYYVCVYALYHNYQGVIAIIMSVLNFIIFYYLYRGSFKISSGHKKRKRTYQKSVRQTQILTRHKCAICGQTEEDDSTLEFCYCSRCKGNYEYCNRHLYTHEHKK